MVVVSARKSLNKLIDESNEFTRVVDGRDVMADLDLIDGIISGETNLPKLPPMTPRSLSGAKSRDEVQLTPADIRRIRTKQHSILLTEYITPRGGSLVPSLFRSLKSDVSERGKGGGNKDKISEDIYEGVRKRRPTAVTVDSDKLNEESYDSNSSSNSANLMNSSVLGREDSYEATSLQRDTYQLLKQICIRTNELLNEMGSSDDGQSSGIRTVGRIYEGCYEINKPLDRLLPEDKLFRRIRTRSGVVAETVVEKSMVKSKPGTRDNMSLSEGSMLDDISKTWESTVEVIKASLKPLAQLNWFFHRDLDHSTDRYLMPSNASNYFDRMPAHRNTPSIPKYGSAVITYDTLQSVNPRESTEQHDPWSVLSALWWVHSKLTGRGVQDSDVRSLRQTAVESATDFWCYAKMIPRPSVSEVSVQGKRPLSSSEEEQSTTCFYKLDSDSDTNNNTGGGYSLDIFNSDNSDDSLDPIISNDSLVSKVRLVMDIAPYNGSRQLITVSIKDGPIHVAKKFAQKFRLDVESRQALCIFLVYLETDSPHYPIDIDCHFSDIKKYFSPTKLLGRTACS